MQAPKDLIKESRKIYGSLTSKAKIATGIIGLVDLIQTAMDAVNRIKLSEDLITITDQYKNFQDASALARCGMAHAHIVPKKFIQSFKENSIPIDPNAGLRSDLTNYIMDGTLPQGKSEEYTKMIAKAGTYLFKTRGTILKNTFFNQKR